MGRIKIHNINKRRLAAILSPLFSHLSPLTTYLLPLIIVTGCTQIDCPVQNTVSTVYELRKGDGTVDTMGVDTMWIWTPRADGSDTLLINRFCGAKATKMTLPISSSQPEDALCVVVADTLGNFWLDSIFIKKENTPHFESVDCQAAFFHTITGVRWTDNIIDSVVIHNSSVTYDASATHIYLYLKPRS